MQYNITSPTLRQARAILGVHVRGKKTWFNRCISGKLSGSSPGSSAAVHSAFASAARGCIKK